MPKFEQVKKVAIRAIEFAKMMDFRIIKSEQYPEGLGKTDFHVQENLKFSKPEHEFEKTKFSMITEQNKDYEIFKEAEFAFCSSGWCLF